MMRSALPRHLQSVKAAVIPNVHLWLAFQKSKQGLLPNVMENLRTAFGDRSPDELAAIASDYSAFYSSRFTLPRKLAKNMRIGQSWWQIEGSDRIEDALRRQRGVIVTSAHFGHVRLIAASLRAHGFPVKLVQAMGTDGEPDARGGERDSEPDKERIRAGLDIRPLLTALSKNQILVLLGDGMRSSSFADLPFLRNRYPFPTGFLKIALATGAAVLPAFALEHRPSRSMVIRILPNLEIRMNADISSNLQLFAHVLEDQIQTSPHLWHRWNIPNLFENAIAWSRSDDRWNHGFRKWCALGHRDKSDAIHSTVP